MLLIRVISYLISIVTFLIWLASLIPGAPIPINCKSQVCRIGTTVVSLDIILLACAIFFFLVARLLHRRQSERL